MVPFKIGTTLLYFLVICFPINIVQATKPGGYANDVNYDNRECLRQIKFAYGNNESATDCFRYAVKHYRKGEYIPGTLEQSLIYARIKYENQTSIQQPGILSNYGEDASSYQPVVNDGNLTSSYQPVQRFGEPKTINFYQSVTNYEEPSSSYQPVHIYEEPQSINYYQPVRYYGESTSSYQPVQSYGESSTYQPVQNNGEPTPSYEPVQNYGELTSIYQQVQNYEEPSTYQPVQNYGEPTPSYEPVQNYGEPTSIYQQVQNYGEPTSSYRPDINTNVQSFNEESDNIVSLDDPLLYLGSFDGLQEFIKKDLNKNAQSFDEQSNQTVMQDENITAQSFVEQISSEQEGDHSIDLSDMPLYIDSFDGLKNFIEADSYINVSHTGDQMSSEQKGPPFNVDPFDGSGSSVQIDHPVNVYTFDGLGSSVQIGPPVNVDPFDGSGSSVQLGPPVDIDLFYGSGSAVQLEPTFNVDGYQNPMLNSQADEQLYAPIPTFNADDRQYSTINTQADIHQYPPNIHQYPPNENQYAPNQQQYAPNVHQYPPIPTFNADGHQYSLIKTQADEHQLPPNYAMAYYTELESMIQGSNIKSPTMFCQEQFYDDSNCLVALRIFGTTTRSAAALAFTDLTLAECVGTKYIYSYMYHIAHDIKIIKPTKMPRNFCTEVYKNKPWYIKLKGYV